MAVFLSPVGGAAAQFFTNSGVILSGGKLYTYAAGTTTPKVTYTSFSGNTAHTNPIILTLRGACPAVRYGYCHHHINLRFTHQQMCLLQLTTIFQALARLNSKFKILLAQDCKQYLR